MAISQEYMEAMNGRKLIILPDYAPWGSKTSIDPNIFKARVLSCQISIGNEIDTATLQMCGLKFGDKTQFMQPIRIGYEDDQKKLVIIWRGFIVKDNSKVNVKDDGINVTALDYKWYLSKITRIRGRIYSTDIATLPTENGSPFTVGDGKFTYEKFRISIADNAGFLQNEPCVFNKDGYPDCCTNTMGTGLKCVFYTGKFTRNESEGITVDTWKGENWKGKYWNFSTILKHVERYWIKPYFSTFTPIRVSSISYNQILAVKADNIVPQNFSLEGLNPASAVDAVVNALPGRWVWWIDYTSGYVSIEIRNIKSNTIQNKSLVLGDYSKLAVTVPLPNVYEASINRDATETIKYAIAYGGAIKVLTTVQLVPLWRRFNIDGTYYDFQNIADYELWKAWNDNEYIDYKDQKDYKNLGMTQEQRERFPMIYRWYGVAREGNNFKNSLANDITQLELTGSIAGEYSVFTKNIVKMFFKNHKSLRKIEPPMFDKYSGNIVLFGYDSKRDMTVPKYKKQKKMYRNLASPAVQAYKKNTHWFDYDALGVGVEIDKENGIVKFNEPQYKRKQLTAESKNGRIAEYETDYKLMASCIIFMTATFATDVPAIMGKKRKNAFIDIFSGANLSGYVEANGADIVFHDNAWYPLRYNAKTVASEVSSTNTLNSQALGTVIRKCKDWRNYQPYIGNGAYELIRALMTYLAVYGDEEITGDVDMGLLGIGWKLGDRIKEIINSTNTAVADSGFYNLKCYVNKIVHSLRGDGKIYSTSISITNRIAKPSSGIGWISSKKTKRKDIHHPFAETDISGIPQVKEPDWSDVEKYL